MNRGVRTSSHDYTPPPCCSRDVDVRRVHVAVSRRAVSASPCCCVVKIDGMQVVTAADLLAFRVFLYGDIARIALVITRANDNNAQRQSAVTWSLGST